MTPKEMLKIIDKAHDHSCRGIGGTAWMAIRDCIEKQMPKKPAKSGSYYICPSCDRFINQHEQSHGNIDIPHCKWCGQALDWSRQGQGKKERNNDST